MQWRPSAAQNRGLVATPFASCPFAAKGEQRARGLTGTSRRPCFDFGGL